VCVCVCVCIYIYIYIYIYTHTYTVCGTRWRGGLRHCASNRKVAGSILDGITGIFH